MVAPEKNYFHRSVCVYVEKGLFPRRCSVAWHQLACSYCTSPFTFSSQVLRHTLKPKDENWQGSRFFRITISLGIQSSTFAEIFSVLLHF